MNTSTKPEAKVYNDTGTFVRYEKIQRANKPYVNVIYSPTSGPLAGQEVARGGFADSLKASAEVIKAMAEGDDITLKVTLNKKGEKTYRNLVGVEKGIQAQPKFQKSRSFTKTDNKGDYNDRAAKGQALNLAFQLAAAQGRAEDDAYILSLVPRMLTLGEKVQNGDYKKSTTTRNSTDVAESNAGTSTKGATADGTTASQQSGAASTGSGTTSEVDDFDDLLADIDF